MSTGERVCWMIVLGGMVMTAAPFVTGDALLPLGQARFALVVVGPIAALSAFVTFFFLRARDKVKRDLLAGRNLLVRWTYAEAEWRAFAGEETRQQAGSKRMLLGFTAVFMAIVTLAFIARDRQAGLFVGAVLFVAWGLCWMVARASVRAQARHEKGPMPEVRIGRDGLLVGDELHDWHGWGATLQECALRDGPPPLLEFTYAMISGNATVRRSESVRVPVPAGKEAEAREIIRQLQA